MTVLRLTAFSLAARMEIALCLQAIKYESRNRCIVHCVAPRMAISKTQVDRLGDRLKQGPHTESDLRLLDEYRRSFSEACEAVVRTIRELGGAPTARLAKSTLSIVEKLCCAVEKASGTVSETKREKHNREEAK